MCAKGRIRTFANSFGDYRATNYTTRTICSSFQAVSVLLKKEVSAPIPKKRPLRDWFQENRTHKGQNYFVCRCLLNIRI